MKRFSRMTAAALALVLLLSITGCGASDGKTHLTFQIWDVAQRASMEAICAAYTAKHPEVDIEVQVTNWTEYWTKLEAAAESNTMPDIFWMHTNQILYYADFGMLADVTDLYADEDPSYYQNHFSEISIGNASGSDGRMYGVPKDKDNIVLVYNKEMFDAAGVSYPTAEWTWDDLTDASQKIYDATGKYGYMAYNDEQLGYWNFVYQNGGYILDPETNLHAGYTQSATADAIDAAMRDSVRYHNVADALDGLALAGGEVGPQLRGGQLVYRGADEEPLVDALVGEGHVDRLPLLGGAQTPRPATPGRSPCIHAPAG